MIGPVNTQQPHLDRVADDAERWDCPSCDRVVEIVRRPGRPRLYCSHACRQRAYRWRRQHAAHTVATPAWPAESATARSTQPFHGHALRSPRDPLSRRRDRHGREVTVCGLLARPHALPRQRGERVPFLAVLPTVCRSCAGLVQPRVLGRVLRRRQQTFHRRPRHTPGRRSPASRRSERSTRPGHSAPRPEPSLTGPGADAAPRPEHTTSTASTPLRAGATPVIEPARACEHDAPRRDRLTDVPQLAR
jgi:hypothetical protein